MSIRGQRLVLRVMAALLIVVLVTGPSSGRAQDSLELVASLEHEGLCAAAISPDGAYLAVRGADGIHVYHSDALDAESVVFPGQFGCQLAFTPDSARLAVIADATVQLLSIEDGALIQAFEGHPGGVTSFAISPDGTRLASSGRDYRTVIWDVETGQEWLSFQQNEPTDTVIYPAMSLAFAPDGSLLAAATRHTIHVWDTQSGDSVAMLNGGVSPGLVAFHADGAFLLMASTVNARFAVWDTGTWDVAAEGMLLIGQRGIAFSPVDRRMAVGTTTDSTPSTGEVHIVDLVTGEPASVLALDDEWPPAVLAYSPDGSILAGGSYDGIRLMLWDPSSGELLASHEAHTDRFQDIQFSPDGSWLVTTGYDDMVRIWQR